MEGQRIPRSRLFFYWTLMTVVPIGLLELVLSAAGVVPLSDREDLSRGFSGLRSIFVEDGASMRTRPDLVGTFNDQRFSIPKGPDTMRIFVLGGSSAYGFPRGAEAAFSSILRDGLTALAPGRKYEVINAAGLSYAIHRINIVADEILGYQPDAIIFYEGHNEFVERDFYRALRGRSAISNALFDALAHTRIYSWLHRMIVPPPPPKRFGETVARTTSHVFGPEEKRQVVADFRAGLLRLIQKAKARGVRVIASTVPANLRDWRPRRSMGGAADVENAEHHYTLAKEKEALGAFDEARREYAAAADLDASPERRLSSINEAIRETAKAEGALLVDADEIFERASPHGLVGFNLIEDYVHPTPEGHALIAFSILSAMQAAGWLGATGPIDRAAFDAVVKARHTDESDNPAFEFNQGVVMENAGAVEEAISKYRRAIALSPGYYAAHGNLALLLYKTGRKEDAAKEADEMARLQPDEPGGLVLRGNLLADRGKLDEAILLYRRATETGSDRAPPYLALGGALRDRGDLDGAKRALEHAVALDPSRSEGHLYLGVSEMELGELDKAKRELDEAARLAPEAARPKYYLGALWERLGRPKEALALYEAALAADPAYAQAKAARERLRSQ